MNLPFEFRERCEVISAEWRDKLELYAYDPLPANMLAARFEATIKGIHEMPELPQDAVEYFMQNGKFWAGTLSRDPVIILYNPKQPPARYESSIMEELAHVILEHPMESLLVDEKQGRENYDPRIESEAKYLASCLIIPRRGLQWAMQKKMADEQIAKHFGTSLKMVKWRRNATKRTHR
jgi:hypothetical protein